MSLIIQHMHANISPTAVCATRKLSYSAIPPSGFHDDGRAEICHTSAPKHPCSAPSPQAYVFGLAAHLMEAYINPRTLDEGGFGPSIPPQVSDERLRAVSTPELTPDIPRNPSVSTSTVVHPLSLSHAPDSLVHRPRPRGLLRLAVATRSSMRPYLHLSDALLKFLF